MLSALLGPSSQCLRPRPKMLVRDRLPGPAGDFPLPLLLLEHVRTVQLVEMAPVDSSLVSRSFSRPLEGGTCSAFYDFTSSLDRSASTQTPFPSRSASAIRCKNQRQLLPRVLSAFLECIAMDAPEGSQNYVCLGCPDGLMSVWEPFKLSRRIHLKGHLRAITLPTQPKVENDDSGNTPNTASVWDAGTGSVSRCRTRRSSETSSGSKSL
ncbi:hypothetical protein FA13DRAFT_1819564 [Coprinellus micaceus]|uniref:Uncharacterized protein n=1 Tax=Coprinellus micaceus TaxID=71717 RepID=A0A4Y7SIF9_COPMI|nr:hypothetical protein FA13DRAFT_1819564 [Coprinellus micaceus]